MKHLKKYEEFDWHSILSNSTFQTLSGFVISNILIRYGGKYLINKKRREYYEKSMKDDLYIRGKWRVSDNGNEITINKEMYNGELKPRYIVNTKTREFQFISDTYPISIKLSKTDLNNMINDLNWVKEVSESIEDFFHDLRDEGLEVELRSTDFINRGITIIVYKKEQTYDYNGDDAGYDSDGGGRTFKLGNYMNQISELISKVEGLYNVKLDDNYKQDRLIYRNEYILKSKDINDINNTGNAKLPPSQNDVNKAHINVLVIPFKR